MLLVEPPWLLLVEPPVLLLVEPPWLLLVEPPWLLLLEPGGGAEAPYIDLQLAAVCFSNFSHIACHLAVVSFAQLGPVGVNISLQSAPNDFSQLSSYVLFLSSILSRTESNFVLPVDLPFCFEDASPDPESSSSDSAGVKVNVYSSETTALLVPDFFTLT